MFCPRGYQSAWADDKAVCPPYDYLKNKLAMLFNRTPKKHFAFFLPLVLVKPTGAKRYSAQDILLLLH